MTKNWMLTALLTAGLLSFTGCGDGGGSGPGDVALADIDAGACVPTADSCASHLDAWDLGFDGATFDCQDSKLAYAGLNDCACLSTTGQGGCGDICDMSLNGTGTPNFCNGVAALPQ